MNRGSGLLEQLAEAADARIEGQEARLARHLADAVLARTAGGRTREGQALESLCRRLDSGLLGRVAADASLIRLTEIDDIHRPTAVTVGALTAPVAWAFARSHHGGADLLRALLVGQETALRLGTALGGARLLTRGLWPSLLVAPVGAAATAACLLGLPPGRQRQALALALAQVPRAPGSFRGQRPGRWLLFGQAVRNGCVAALAAADGIDGDPDLLDHAWLQGIGGDLARAEALRSPVLLSESLSIKPHPSAKQALAALHGLQQLLARGVVQAADIEAIEVHVPPSYAGMLDRDPPTTSRLARLVNVRWQMALAALRPDALDDVAREDDLADDSELQAFAARVRVLPDAALDVLYPEAFPARLVVRAAAQRHELQVNDSPGDPPQAFDDAQLLDKARRVLGPDAPLAPLRHGLALAVDPGALHALRVDLGYAEHPDILSPAPPPRPTP
jgi:2-methylcitrate dehydratase PrpD